MVGRAAPVYHVGSSDKHRCSVGRAAELIVLSHRRHLRQPQQSRAERLLKSRWDAVLVEPSHPLGLKSTRALVRGFDEAIDLLPGKLQRKLGRLIRKVHDADDDFAKLDKVVKLYHAVHVRELLRVQERRAFRRAPLPSKPSFASRPERLFEWRSYWLDVHMPGLRRWAFPLIEGKRPGALPLPSTSAEAAGETSA